MSNESKAQALQKIDELILKIEKYEEDYNRKLSSSTLGGSAKLSKSFTFKFKMRNLSAIHERLDVIRKILITSKYNLAFIGKIGVGKTTAICHLFDLLLDEEKTIDDELETVTTPLLSTGSGRTTICEVVVKSSATTYIEIEPYSDDEINDQISSFCKQIWEQVHPQDEQEEPIDMPSELARAIKNIASLKGEEGKKIAQDHSSCESFYSEIISRCQLGKRVDTIVKIAQGDISRRKKSIQKKFEDLNLGKIKTVSIPKKIVLYLDSDILDLGKYRFDSIMDTRGMDMEVDRKDLSHHIRFSADTICILCEKFADMPSNVISLIKKYLTSESRDIDTKMILLGLPQGSEPGDLMGQNGKVSSYRKGIDVRRDQVIDKFSSQSIKFLPDNIIFYNSLRYYDTNKCKQREDKIKKEKLDILGKISLLIDRREETLIKEVFDLADCYERIRKGEMNDSDKDLIERLKKTVIKINHDVPVYPVSFQTKFINALKSYHTSVFRAINNRYGTYTFRNIDIYFNARSLTEDLVRDSLNKSKSEIIGAIRRTEEQSKRNSILKDCLQVLKDQVDKDYEDLIIEVSEIGYQLVFSNLSPMQYGNQFWSRAIDRWGQGPGYTNDVHNMYKTQLSSIDQIIKDEVQQRWKRLLEELIDSLTVS